ncbi:MaoC/PaaZ C-terminal domain-containing protein [Nitratireductor sp. ZSWI3]|uniref:MaoC/PaaZ C-terminal domain-containing protein n=1 Tax=Nitratireductor sp. ZSWI3 TaxID=2966359 RepID=UPI00214F937C|nr:MaoC/PaaZ C-terminal domain-containing protein [Nitratireductor sp. ZSWI3]MCR4265277.1 MaoC/PaaZ C-terminal domain-containing protein [Nitratireductor sp. ZSWI3]
MSTAQAATAGHRTMYFEDFSPGQVFQTGGRTITETDLTMFSMLTGDWNAIHSDADYARTTRYGERLVHGSFGIGLAIGLMHGLGIFEGSAVAMLGISEWRFERPILIGTTLHLRLEVIDAERGRTGRTGRIGRHFKLIDGPGEVVQQGRSDVLVLTRAGLIE